ncbi:hypothetical protein KC362_g37 [Hortaea werneckii]|nr:hypothetical protein KC362_g37 [Hortaea werneckii]
MALGLHEAAHDAVDGVEGLVGGVGDEGGDDGVVGPLVFAEDVRVVGRLEDEVGGAVLEREAAVAGDDAGAEARVVGVDEGHAVSGGVGHGEVDSVGAAFGAFREVLWGDEGGSWDRRYRGVSDEPVPVREGDTERFDNGVEESERTFRVVRLCLEPLKR